MKLIESFTLHPLLLPSSFLCLSIVRICFPKLVGLRPSYNGSANVLRPRYHIMVGSVKSRRVFRFPRARTISHSSLFEQASDIMFAIDLCAVDSRLSKVVLAVDVEKP